MLAVEQVWPRGQGTPLKMGVAIECRIEYDAGMTERTNPVCPDYSSHRQNAEERYFAPHPVPATLHRGEDDAISADAEVEYMACEGH